MQRLIIVGPLPPPIGGVGVHIYRYFRQNRNKFDIHIIDYSRLHVILKFAALLRIVFLTGKPVFYINHVNKLVFLALLTRPFYKDIIFYDHNFRYIEKINGFEKAVFFAFIKRIKKISVVNESIIKYYADYGLDIQEKVSIVNPFIPPPLDEEIEIVDKYPEKLKQFILDRTPLIVANAVRLEKYRDTDLYGLDLCIELTRLLKNDFKDLGFIFFLSEPGGKDFDKMTERIVSYDIRENFIFVHGNNQLWPLFKKCNLFVRPTCTDGDAISIREALYFNKTVIASDVVERPKDVILFKNRDIDDYYLKVKEALLHKH